MIRHFGISLIVLGLVFCIGADEMDLKTAYDRDGIVPDVIDVVPGEILKIVYPSGVEVNLGNELTPTQVKDQPQLDWSANPNKFYTLIFSDPDAPSRKEPKFREVKHWVVVNIPGKNISEGEVIAEFIGSGPPSGTGLHRYSFVIHEQTGKIDFSAEPKTTNRSRDNRLNFSARDFAVKYSLGKPIAGNFYQAQFDDYVPLLHKQLSGE